MSNWYKLQDAGSNLIVDCKSSSLDMAIQAVHTDLYIWFNNSASSGSRCVYAVSIGGQNIPILWKTRVHQSEECFICSAPVSLTNGSPLLFHQKNLPV